MSKSLIYDLAANSSLREEFCENPGSVFEKYGISAEGLDLPSKMDPSELERKLDALLAGTLLDGLDVNSLAQMSADELWSNFPWIRRQDDSERVVTPVAKPVTPVTIYAAPGITDIIGPREGVLNPERQIKDWQALRDLEDASPAEIRITVHGPDDVIVDNLAPHVAATFIRRLFRNNKEGR